MLPASHGNHHALRILFNFRSFILEKSFTKFLNCNPIKCVRLQRGFSYASLYSIQRIKTSVRTIPYYRPLRSNNNYFLYPLQVYVEFIYSIFSIGFLFRGKASSPTNPHTVSTPTPLYYLKFPPRPIFFSKPPPFFCYNIH